jgi:23S rRNA (uracil1939-C5)-methyltransferase
VKDPATAAAGAQVTLRLDAMAHGGTAMGRAEDGRMVFAHGGLPGETATVRLTEIQPRFARGVLAELPAAPSPDRLPGAPRCASFGAWPERGARPERFCGGCDWQHVDYAAQLRFKAEILRDALRRIGGLDDPPVAPVIGMDDPWHYRNQIRVRTGPGGTGFVALDHATIVPIPLCHVAHPLVQELLESLDLDLPPGIEISLRAGINTEDTMVVIHAPADLIETIDIDSDASVILARPAGGAEVAAGRPYLLEAVAGQVFMIPPRAFFQVNTAMTEILVGLVRAAVPPGTRTLVDVYSGVGLLGVLLADRVGELCTIETDPDSVAAAMDNAAGLDNVTLIEADAAEALEYLGLVPDVVVVDPPRAGMAPDALRLLTRLAPPTIVYVSCDPATLARDVRRLVAGGWRLSESQPVDLFPQTYHVESVNVLRRQGARSDGDAHI